MQYIYRHNKLQKEYHSLVGVAAGKLRLSDQGSTFLKKNWPCGSRYEIFLRWLSELVDALEQTLRGDPVKPEQLETLCAQLMFFSTNPDTSLPVSRVATLIFKPLGIKILTPVSSDVAAAARLSAALFARRWSSTFSNQ